MHALVQKQLSLLMDDLRKYQTTVWYIPFTVPFPQL